MQTAIVVVGTHKPEHFLVTVTDLDQHMQAGEFREFIGSTYPCELANWIAQQEGERRTLPVILAA